MTERFLRLVAAALAVATIHFTWTVVSFCAGDPLANRDVPPSRERLLLDFVGHPLTCISLMSTRTPAGVTLLALLADSLLWGLAGTAAWVGIRHSLRRPSPDVTTAD